MELDNFDAIIFDLGGVILNLNYDLTVIEFEKQIQNLDRKLFFGKKDQLPFFSSYEIGKTQTSTFIEEFNRFYQKSFTESEFAILWNAMILDMPRERISLVRRLRLIGKKVFLLSNINELHELAVEQRFNELGEKSNFLNEFDNGYYSHKIGLRKPNREIFEFVIDHNSLLPNRTLFIDDSVHHVEGARSFGIESIHLESGQQIESLSFLYV
jgi:HAD superfamily hydrolase (TIGR01509 family)